MIPVQEVKIAECLHFQFLFDMFEKVVRWWCAGRCYVFAMLLRCGLRCSCDMCACFAMCFAMCLRCCLWCFCDIFAMWLRCLCVFCNVFAMCFAMFFAMWLRCGLRCGCDVCVFCAVFCDVFAMLNWLIGTSTLGPLCMQKAIANIECLYLSLYPSEGCPPRPRPHSPNQFANFSKKMWLIFCKI